jgi:WD40 repeat protein
MDSLSIQNHSGDTSVFRAATLLDDSNTVLASDGSSISSWTVDKGHTKTVPFEGDSEHLAKIQSVSISPDGQLVATAAGNQTIVIWEAESGKILCGPIEGHADYIRGLGFSPDSKMVVSGSDDQKVSIWSVETGQSIHGPMEGHEAGVGEVCFRCILPYLFWDLRIVSNAPDQSRWKAGC